MAKPLDALSGIRYGLVRRDDQIEGVRLLRVDPSSLPAQYGLQEGDIVRAVNGRLLDKTFNPLEMVPQLIKATTVRVQIRRDDKDLELTYELK
jgi:type II secretory pathway component PulC